MKHITYKFIDGSEIDIANDQTATIVGSTKQLAYSLWGVATQDISAKNIWAYIFCQICNQLHSKYSIVIEYTDHFSGVTVIKGVR